MQDPRPRADRKPSLAFALFLIFVAVFLQLRQCQHLRALREQPAPGAAPTAAPSIESDGPGGEAAAGAEPTAFPTTTSVARDDRIELDTDLYRVRFTNHGAALLELHLKKYFRATGVAGDPAMEADRAHWLPLVPLLDAARPTFVLRRNPTGDAGRALPLDASNWEVTRSQEGGAKQLTFRFADGEGRRFEKVFRFRDGRYDFTVELRFASDRPGPAQGADSYLFLGAGGIWDERASPFQSPPAAVVTVQDESEVKLLPASDLEDGPQSVAFARGGRLSPFFGAASNYFAFALEPDPDTVALVEGVTCSRAFDPFTYDRALQELRRRGKAPDDSELRELRSEHETNVHAEAALRVPFPAAGQPPRTMRFDVFAGAKSPAAMAGAEHESFRVLYEVEYGSWNSLRWINRVLLWWMRLMHALTGNWGVAIILLTLTVKILLFPLNRLQSRSMEQFQKKMKALQPQLEELKKRYKNNLQKLNAEQQKIMREHGVRPPVFGCLVVFLQMPVWYGLFQIMRTAPELRQAPFFGWISDLSAPDLVPLPFELPLVGGLHLLPILMVIAWLLQNRMMPKATDPQQAQMQKMMNFFPFIFGVMLYKYASGQSLYMLTNSLLGMLQMRFLRVTPTN